MDKKITKKEVLEIIAVRYYDMPIVVDYCQKEINRLNKEQEAKQKDERLSDNLYCAIINIMSNNNSKMLTAQDIIQLLKGEDLTLAKVRAKLSFGVSYGALQKEFINNKIYYKIIKGDV